MTQVLDEPQVETPAVQDPRPLIELAVLDWVNMIRQQRGMDLITCLPRGEQRRPTRCVLGVALNAQVSRNEILFYRNGSVSYEKVPQFVGDFIAAFDEGAYPHLVARRFLPL